MAGSPPPEPIRHPRDHITLGRLLGLRLIALNQRQRFLHTHQHNAVGGDQPSALHFLVPVWITAVGDQGVLGLEQLRLRFDRQIALGLVPPLEGIAVLGANVAEVVQAYAGTRDEVLDQCPVAHAVDAGLEDHLVVELLLIG